jgi:hypothetical protein
MSRTVLSGMLVLGIMACSSVAARELGDRAADRTLVVGTLIEAKIEDARSWRRNPLGETLTASVSGDVTNARRSVVIPAGSAVGLRIAHWRPATNPDHADARITLDVLSVTVGRRRYAMRATAELTPAAVRQPGGEVVAVAPGTRILFVLSQRFTAATP